MLPEPLDSDVDPERKTLNDVAILSALPPERPALADFVVYNAVAGLTLDTLDRLTPDDDPPACGAGGWCGESDCPRCQGYSHPPGASEPDEMAPYAVDAEDLTPGDPYRGEAHRGGRGGHR